MSRTDGVDCIYYHLQTVNIFIRFTQLNFVPPIFWGRITPVFIVYIFDFKYILLHFADHYWVRIAVLRGIFYLDFKTFDLFDLVRVTLPNNCCWYYFLTAHTTNVRKPIMGNKAIVAMFFISNFTSVRLEVE